MQARHVLSCQQAHRVLHPRPRSSTTRHSARITRSRAFRPFVQAASTDVQHKSGEELKQQLLTAIKADEGLIRTGRLTAEVKEAVEQIEAAAEAAPLHLGPGEVDGQFELLLNTTNYLDDDACTTLGTLTFQQFGPSDLRLRVYYSEVLTGVQSPTQYCTRSYFKVTDCEHEGLEGVQSALGEYELDTANPARQNVFFTGIRMEPSSSDPAALKAWVDLLSESNASMDPSTGVAEVKFPKKIKGTRDFILLDNEIQVTLGNRGSLVIIRRKYPPPL